MSKTFARLDPWLWWDPRFRQLADDAKLTYLFLMIHPNLNMLGAMRTMATTLAADMNFKWERFSAAFGELTEAEMIRYDDATLFLYIPGFLDKNRPANPSVVKSWPRWFSSLPDCELRRELADEISFVLSKLPENFRVFDFNHSGTVQTQSSDSVQTISTPSQDSVDNSSSSSSSKRNRKSSSSSNSSSKQEQENLCRAIDEKELSLSSEKKEKEKAGADGATDLGIDGSEIFG